MEITEAQYERIAPIFPVQRGNVRLSNLQIKHSAGEYVKRKNGVLDRVFEYLQREQIVRIKLLTKVNQGLIV